MKNLKLIILFFFNDTAPPEIYPLPLHDALPIYKAVVTRHQLVQLATGARILVLEARRAFGRGLRQRLNDFVVDRRQDLARPWKEAHDSRKAVRNSARGRASQRERFARPRQADAAAGIPSCAAPRPELVRKMPF